MNFKSILVASLAILLALSAIVSAIPAGSANPVLNSRYNLINNAFNGTVTIEANGSLSAAGAPITHSGNYYNLTENVNGTITINHNNTIFNGNGYTVFGGPAFYMLNVSNSNSVTISDLNINSTEASFGVMTYNTSNDKFSNIILNAAGVSFFAGNYSTGVSVINSNFKTYGSIPNIPGNVMLGLYFGSGGSPIGFPSSNSHNFTLYNDTFLSSSTATGLADGGNNITVSNSYFTDNNVLLSFITGANNSDISNNHFNDNGTGASIFSSSPFNGHLSNVTIKGNTVIANKTSSGYKAIESSGSGTVSDNSLLINATQVSVTGITALSENTTLNSNTVDITNGGASSNQILGIQTLGSNHSMSDNRISISGGSGSGIQVSKDAVFTNNIYLTGNTINMVSGNAVGILAPSSGLRDSVISNNILTLTGTLCQGIQFAGSNISVSGNQINVNQSDTSGLDVIIGYGYGEIYNNVSVANNEIRVAGSTGNLQVKGIYFDGSGTHVAIIGNDIRTTQLSNQVNAIGMQGINNITVSFNYLSMKAVYQAINIAQTSNAVLEGNTVIGNIGGVFGSAALEVFSSSNTGIFNNSFSNFNYTISTNLVNGLTFSGNYVQNISTYILTSDADSNMVFYHNNFINYTGVIFPASSETNITFNMSLPLGGNYWNNYKGTDGNGDGIGDTPFSLGSGYYDNLPLMKEWTRPRAVFTETGLYPGTSWSVTFNGHTQMSNTASIVFNIVNATYQSYNYNIHSVSRFRLVTKSSGTQSYTGNGSQTNVQYNPPLTFTLKEAGLPSGTSWTVLINGTSHIITGTNYTVTGYDGTSLNYSVSNTTLYYSSIYSGSYTLNSTNKTVDITFTHYSYIVGNVPGSGFSLFINGIKQNLSAGSFNLTITAGSYDIVVKTLSGSNYENETIQPGQTVNITSLFKNSPPGGTPNYVYYAGGAVAAALAVGSIAYFMRKRISGK